MNAIGVIVIVIFLFMIIKEKIQQVCIDSKIDQIRQKKEWLWEEGPSDNRIRQIQLYYQYVRECKCLNKSDFERVKKKTEELCKKITDPLMVQALTIDDNDPYKHPNPFILEEIRKYASMTDYERYLLARKRLNSEGYSWNDKFNPGIPSESPRELKEYYDKCREISKL